MRTSAIVFRLLLPKQLEFTEINCFFFNKYFTQYNSLMLNTGLNEFEDFIEIYIGNTLDIPKKVSNVQKNTDNDKSTLCYMTNEIIRFYS